MGTDVSSFQDTIHAFNHFCLQHTIFVDL